MTMFKIQVSMLALVMCNYLMFFASAVQQNNRALNAFNNDINKCFFNYWHMYTAIGVKLTDKEVVCTGPDRVGLCYGFPLRGKKGQWETLFAVCYDKTTRIPVFTGHIVSDHTGLPEANRDFRNEAGDHGPGPQEQSDYNADYEKYSQRPIIGGTYFRADNEGFYGRGHLTPFAAFGTVPQRDLTMINTNIAPQWQLFNSQNWARLEAALVTYSNERKKDLYVVTGTGGENLKADGQRMYLNGRVLVPAYFWKAVCDLAEKSSVVFVAANPTGREGTQKQGGCQLDISDQHGVKLPPPQMTPGHGIIQCYSLKELKLRPEGQLFSLPPFGENCESSLRGTFLDTYLRKLK